MMKLRRIEKENGWTKLLIVLALLCSVFSVGINAQNNSDKPMSAQSLTALVMELKGVVARTEPNQKNSTMVANKWDARKDLTGKSKIQVINLLYEDVKSVILDSGTQYQISTMFSMYKQMPDDAASGQTSSKIGSNSKLEAIKQLTNLTFSDHP